VFTIGANLAGLPAISIPAGFAPARVDAPSRNRLPIGLHLCGRRLAEPALLHVAAVHEAAARWQLEHPPLASSTEAPKGSV